jgi:hypothetical protein
VRSRPERNMCPDRKAKDRGAGPESGGGSSETKQQGSGTRVFCGVTGNRSVSGRWQRRKHAGQSPLGGAQEGVRVVRDHSQAPGAFSISNHRVVVSAGGQWELCPPADDARSGRWMAQGTGRSSNGRQADNAAVRKRFHHAAFKKVRTAASNARGWSA